MPTEHRALTASHVLTISTSLAWNPSPTLTVGPALTMSAQLVQDLTPQTLPLQGTHNPSGSAQLGLSVLALESEPWPYSLVGPPNPAWYTQISAPDSQAQSCSSGSLSAL